MTTRKIIIVVAAIVLTLALIVVVIAAGVVGIAFYSMGNSEAAQTAKDFLRTNQILKQDIGEVKDFGMFPTGNIHVTNNDGNATINLKVIGEKKTVNASVDLIYRSGRPWRVVAASYRNEEGKTIDLLNPYESVKIPRPSRKRTFQVAA